MRWRLELGTNPTGSVSVVVTSTSKGSELVDRGLPFPWTMLLQPSTEEPIDLAALAE